LEEKKYYEVNKLNEEVMKDLEKKIEDILSGRLPDKGKNANMKVGPRKELKEVNNVSESQYHDLRNIDSKVLREMANNF
jgi:hypothetical protein